MINEELRPAPPAGVGRSRLAWAPSPHQRLLAGGARLRQSLTTWQRSCCVRWGIRVPQTAGHPNGERRGPKRPRYPKRGQRPASWAGCLLHRRPALPLRWRGRRWRQEPKRRGGGEGRGFQGPPLSNAISHQADGRGGPLRGGGAEVKTPAREQGLKERFLGVALGGALAAETGRAEAPAARSARAELRRLVHLHVAPGVDANLLV